MKSLDELKAATDAAKAEEIVALQARLADLGWAPFGASAPAPDKMAKMFLHPSSSRGYPEMVAAAKSVRHPKARKLAAEIVAGTESDPKAKAKVKAKVSPDQAKSRRLQGVYISLLRKFSGQEKAEFQALAKEKGRAAAIKAMKAEAR